MTQTSPSDLLNVWLIGQGLKARGREDMLRAFCEQLVNYGVPLVRMQLAQRALHPEFGGIGFTWTRAEGMHFEYFRRPDQAQEDWYASPFYALIKSGEAEMQADLTGPEVHRFPIFADLRAKGATSYFVHWQPIGEVTRRDYDPERLNTEGVLASWTFDGDPAEAERHRDVIRGCFETLVVVLSTASNREMGRSLLKVYLGRDAGERVLSGEIRRGSSELIDAVICLFDLRGFTTLSEQLPGEALVDLLNDYFGHVVEVIQAHGGNILKFLGDGVMAMFNVGTLEEDARAALRAVSELAPRMEAVNAARATAGLPLAQYSVALHAGEILYGNIGAPNRLDFTVIGPAVNLTARIADMHRTVERPIILSEDVRRAVGGDAENLVSVGRYMLRGVAAPIELFTLYIPEEAPAS
ncbi:adenylate/guanylate cyclase domain-containing protein [Phaeobacter sp. B1627]|uniref:adenylate/guanylate cyclase domain-containing protein n=1 Tax=Phaeobacter sp. B1627 TaxID=2583809 RepID=UPI001119D87F|nr:adenylate/guanylate cyclase domain-containing protein [Phaeobacter sp. B1627]TNJ41114.1 adenylate/guanylate cyclase domain-containing protein [Phaeobacter sp. B1627]